jgi:F0F1-type ATP synthase assembly protein I
MNQFLREKVRKRYPLKNEKISAFRKAAPYLNIGYVLLGSVVFFGFIGYTLDEKFQISPLFLILGIFLGLILGFYNMFKVINNLKK